ncbi:MAG: glutamate--tRNA ligase [Methylocystaceae bacterium]
MPQIKVRFAPSPTGPLHIGGARSALFNYLYARHHGGVFLIRTEDTDVERSRPEYEEEILEVLSWLGMTWDEGIKVGGESEPYRQTERLATYDKLANELQAAGHAYYCFCSEQDLEAEREQLLQAGQMVKYQGRCRHLTSSEVEQKLASGIKPALRFKVETGSDIQIPDQVRGEVTFPRDNIGDFIIVKSDGIPTYNFAVVADDHLMQVSHVIRAEEHLSNTPRQILIYEALGWEPPQFGHISLILGADRQKMSKRHGATSVTAYRDQGYLPEAMVNFLALLGWSPDSEQELFSLDELEHSFSLERVSKSPAVFDLDKLNHINREHIKLKSDVELGKLLKPYLLQSDLKELVQGLSDERYAYLVHCLRDYLNFLGEAPVQAAVFLVAPVLGDTAREVLSTPEAKQVLKDISASLPTEVTPEKAKAFLKDFIKQGQLNGKAVYLPLRCALTGQEHGPELPYLMAVMGNEEIKSRLNAVL